MRKRRLWLMLIGVLVLVGVSVALLNSSREPEYEGRTLSEWVRRYDIPEPPYADAQRHQAIREMGTKALPYLLKWIQYEASPWKAKTYNSINGILHTLNRNWNMRDEQMVRGSDAIRAFGSLGPKAERAIIGDLSRLLNDSHAPSMAAARAALALSQLEDAGIPPLVASLTNRDPDLRRLVVQILGSSQSSAARAAVPTLIQLLDDPDWRVRKDVTNALRGINPATLDGNVPPTGGGENTAK